MREMGLSESVANFYPDQPIQGDFGIEKRRTINGEHTETTSNELSDKVAIDLAENLYEGELIRRPKPETTELKQEGVLKLVDSLVDNNQTEQLGNTIVRISRWIESDTDEWGRQQKITSIEQHLANKLSRYNSLQEKSKLNLPVLMLLGEIDQQRLNPFVDESLIATLGIQPQAMPEEVKQQLYHLNRTASQASTLAMHKILDFFETFSITLQNPNPNVSPEVEYWGLSMDLEDLTKHAREEAPNYLLAAHWQGLYESEHPFLTGKPDDLKGIAGYGSDRMMSLMNRDILVDSYYNRLALGMVKDYPELYPTIPVSDDYMGFHVGGRLKSYFREDKETVSRIQTAEKVLLEENDPQDNEIYWRLMDIVDKGKRFGSSPDQVMAAQLPVVQGFIRHQQETGGNFYFSLKDGIIEDDPDEPGSPFAVQWELEKLHPQVLLYILEHNQKVLAQSFELPEQAKPVPLIEVLGKQFPAGKISPNVAYTYNYAMGLANRMRLEQEIGLNVANIPDYSRVQLVHFLHSRTPEEFARVVQAGQHLGGYQQGEYFSQNLKDFYVSFLSYAEDPANGEVILNLAEKLPSKFSSKVFTKYANMVAGAEQIKEFTKAEFGEEEISDTGTKLIVGDIFAKANLLLKHIAKVTENPDNDERAEVQLEAFREKVAIYVSVLGELTKQGRVSMREQVSKNSEIRQGGSFSEKEIQEMNAIFSFGRSEVFPEELLNASEAEFKEKLTDPRHTYYVYKQGGHVIAFFYADRISEDTLYVGGLNISPESRKEALGMVFIKTWLAELGSNNNIKADVLEMNKRAFNLYRRILGFKQDKSNPVTVIEGKNGGKYNNVNIIRKKTSARELPEAA